MWWFHLQFSWRWINNNLHFLTLRLASIGFPGYISVSVLYRCNTHLITIWIRGWVWQNKWFQWALWLPGWRLPIWDTKYQKSIFLPFQCCFYLMGRLGYYSKSDVPDIHHKSQIGETQTNRYSVEFLTDKQILCIISKWYFRGRVHSCQTFIQIFYIYQ